MEQKQNDMIRQFILNVRKDQAKLALEDLKQIINLKQVERQNSINISDTTKNEGK